jgi:hypothetical protein
MTLPRAIEVTCPHCGVTHQMPAWMLLAPREINGEPTKWRYQCRDGCGCWIDFGDAIIAPEIRQQLSWAVYTRQPAAREGE